MQKEKNVIELVTKTMQLKGYEYKTQQNYLKWIKAYLLYHGKNPVHMGIVEIERFKNYISLTKTFSHEIKRQASQAIIFLYTQVLGINLQNEYIQATRNLRPKNREKRQKIVQSVMVF